MDKDLFDYLTSLIPDALIDCDGCTRQVKASEAINREGKYFHSERCAEMVCAPLVKPQPKSSNIDPALEGWT